MRPSEECLKDCKATLALVANGWGVFFAQHDTAGQHQAVPGPRAEVSWQSVLPGFQAQQKKKDSLQSVNVRTAAKNSEILAANNVWVPGPPEAEK